jgi:SLT domain-containing protein
MPTDDPVSKALAGAKNALASARNFTKSAGDTDPSRFAAKPAAPKPAAKPASGGMAREASDVGSGLRWRAEQVKNIGEMKKGGTIPKTGSYKMHKGEEVVTADKSNLQDVIERAKDSLGGPMRPAHGMRSTRIDHHSNGSHTVTHVPHMNTMDSKSNEDISYAVKNHAELASKIKEYLGDKEEMAEGDKKKDSKSEESAEKV